MNGVLVVDKPQGFTSFDVVAVVRGLAREKKVGHTGTLDPMATGVLPLLLGRAAKAADLLPNSTKAYRAGFRLGERTDTGDITGKIMDRSHVRPTHRQLRQAAAGFLGVSRQTPPMYSAVSVNGQRLYKLARQGKEVERESREIQIDRLDIEAYSPETGEGILYVSCGKGTYIRTLIEDIAKQVGTLGVMTALRRTEACGFTLEQAIPLEQLRAETKAGGIEKYLRPTELLFAQYPAVYVSEKQAQRFQNGGALELARLRLPERQTPQKQIRVFSRQENRFLGLGAVDGEKAELKVCKLFAPAQGG